MSQIIDRRLNAGKKSMVNRQRFIRRYKAQIKKAISRVIGERSITEVEKGERISIPTKDISEPSFQRGKSGYVEQILPGNEEFIAGDLIRRPSGAEQNKDAGQSNTQETGEDTFVFQLSREEFMELYFEDLELPDLVKKELTSITTFKTIRTGVSTSGTPCNINIVRSMRQAAARRMALTSPYKRRLRLTKETLENLETETKTSKKDPELIRLKEDISLLKKKINTIPFIDTIDLRYNNRIRVPQPSTQAVMFCVMDVSGSMDEAKKDIAKRFFILLYLFLTKNYKKIELVFIRHHTSAKEVNEEEFFYSRETGGTVVSSALELLIHLIQTRYPPALWNIYVAQASDGDNWNADSPYCQELIKEKIIPFIQYFTYIEIMPRHHQSLWEAYQKIKSTFHNFAMENIDQAADIYPVFRNLFKKESA